MYSLPATVLYLAEVNSTWDGLHWYAVKQQLFALQAGIPDLLC